jgi:DnaJ-class molecular chaperone
MEKCPICGGTGKIFKKVKVGAETKTMEVRCKQCDGKGLAGSQNCPVCRGEKI